jgi:hypothetical protein
MSNTAAKAPNLAKYNYCVCVKDTCLDLDSEVVTFSRVRRIVESGC